MKNSTKSEEYSKNHSFSTFLSTSVNITSVVLLIFWSRENVTLRFLGFVYQKRVTYKTFLYQWLLMHQVYIHHTLLLSDIPFIVLITAHIKISIFNKVMYNNSLLFICCEEKSLFTWWTAQLQMGHAWNGNQHVKHVTLTVSLFHSAAFVQQLHLDSQICSYQLSHKFLQYNPGFKQQYYSTCDGWVHLQCIDTNYPIFTSDVHDDIISLDNLI